MEYKVISLRMRRIRGNRRKRGSRRVIRVIRGVRERGGSGEIGAPHKAYLEPEASPAPFGAGQAASRSRGALMRGKGNCSIIFLYEKSFAIYLSPQKAFLAPEAFSLALARGAYAG